MAKDLTKGDPTKLILRYSIPLLIGNVVQQLYSMADTMIVGKIMGNDKLAAVGATGAISFLVLGFLFGITGGFAVIVAQRYGARDEEGLRHSVATSIILCLILTVLLTIVSLATAMPLLKLMNTPKGIIQDSYDYISVIYMGIVCTMFYNMFAGILRAIGDSKSPLYFLMVSAFLNIGLDFLFILVFHTGVAGAAWATVISQGVSVVLCLFYAWKKYPILRLQRKHFRLDIPLVKKHFMLGIPMALQFSITAVGVMILQGALNVFGTSKIAAYTAATKTDQLVTQPAGTFGVAMANYAGQNLGAGRIDRIKEGVKKCSYLTLVFAIGAAVILYLFGRPMTGIFLKHKTVEVVESAQLYLNTIAIFLPALNLLFVYRNVLQGIGKSFMPLMAGVFELVARAVCAYTLPKLIGFRGICLAGPIAWLAAAIPLAITYFIVIRKMMNDSKSSAAVS